MDELLSVELLKWPSEELVECRADKAVELTKLPGAKLAKLAELPSVELVELVKLPSVELSSAKLVELPICRVSNCRVSS